MDEILVGVGRAPNLEGLGLEKAGIAFDPRQGVKVDERLRTSQPAGLRRRRHLLPLQVHPHRRRPGPHRHRQRPVHGQAEEFRALIIPWCTYTDPEVAHVGMYEREARKRGIAVTTLTVPLGDVDRAVLDGETEGFARVHLKKGSDTIIGATIVARHAGEMINELTLAMTTGLGLSAIGRTIHPYPTQAEAVKKLADAYNRTRLTPLVKKITGCLVEVAEGIKRIRISIRIARIQLSHNVKTLIAARGRDCHQ